MNSRIVEKTNKSIKEIDRLTDVAAINVYATTNEALDKYDIMNEHASLDYMADEFYQESVLAGVLIGAGIIGVAVSAFFIIKKIINSKAKGEGGSGGSGSSVSKTDLTNEKSIKQHEEELKKIIAGFKNPSQQVQLPIAINADQVKAMMETFGKAKDRLVSITDETDPAAISNIIKTLKVEELEDADPSKLATKNPNITCAASEILDKSHFELLLEFCKLYRDLYVESDKLEKKMKAKKEAEGETAKPSDEDLAALRKYTETLSKKIGALPDAERAFMAEMEQFAIRIGKEAAEEKIAAENQQNANQNQDQNKPADGSDGDDKSTDKTKRENAVGPDSIDINPNTQRILNDENRQKNQPLTQAQQQFMDQQKALAAAQGKGDISTEAIAQLPQAQNGGKTAADMPEITTPHQAPAAEKSGLADIDEERFDSTELAKELYGKEYPTDDEKKAIEAAVEIIRSGNGEKDINAKRQAAIDNIILNRNDKNVLNKEQTNFDNYFRLMDFVANKMKRPLNLGDDRTAFLNLKDASDRAKSIDRAKNASNATYQIMVFEDLGIDKIPVSKESIDSKKDEMINKLSNITPKGRPITISETSGISNTINILERVFRNMTLFMQNFGNSNSRFSYDEEDINACCRILELYKTNVLDRSTDWNAFENSESEQLNALGRRYKDIVNQFNEFIKAYKTGNYNPGNIKDIIENYRSNGMSDADIRVQLKSLGFPDTEIDAEIPPTPSQEKGNIDDRRAAMLNAANSAYADWYDGFGQDFVNIIYDNFNGSLIEYLKAAYRTPTDSPEDEIDEYNRVSSIAAALGDNVDELPKPPKAEQNQNPPTQPTSPTPQTQPTPSSFENYQDTLAPTPTETEEPKKGTDEGAPKDTQTENSDYPADAVLNNRPELKKGLIDAMAGYMKQYPDLSDDEVFRVGEMNTLKISPEMAKELKTSARELANKESSENVPTETEEPKKENPSEPEKKPEDQNTGENTQETTPETSTEEPETKPEGEKQTVSIPNIDDEIKTAAFDNIPENFSKSIADTVVGDINGGRQFDGNSIAEFADELIKSGSSLDFAQAAKSLQNTFKQMARACTPKTDAVNKYISDVENFDVTTLQSSAKSGEEALEPMTDYERKMANEIVQIPAAAIANAKKLANSAYDDETKRRIRNYVVGELQKAGNETVATQFSKTFDEESKAQVTNEPGTNLINSDLSSKNPTDTGGSDDDLQKYYDYEVGGNQVDTPETAGNTIDTNIKLALETLPLPNEQKEYVKDDDETIRKIMGSQLPRGIDIINNIDREISAIGEQPTQISICNITSKSLLSAYQKVHNGIIQYKRARDKFKSAIPMVRSDYGKAVINICEQIRNLVIEYICKKYKLGVEAISARIPTLKQMSEDRSSVVYREKWFQEFQKELIRDKKIQMIMEMQETKSE